MPKTPIVALCLCLCSNLLWGADAPGPQQFWPQWRGPDANGVAPHGDPPIEWSEDKNVRWKVPIPGKGHASPIVWGGRVFVATAVPTGEEVEAEPAQTQDAPQGRRRGPQGIQPTQVHKFVVMALDRKDGSVVWRKTLREERPHEGTHPDGSWASNSPITDGEHVYVHFGSRGLYCLDLEGNLKWEKDLGDMRVKLGFGEGSSPALHGDMLVVVWDHEDQSFLTALDKRTGEEIWKVDREEATSWATPLVVEHGGKPQIITSATRLVRSYDLATGGLVWETPGMTANAIPSPVAADGTVYLISGFRGNSLMAVRLEGAKGDIRDSESILWKHDRDTPYVPSPLLYGDTLYFLKSNAAILSSWNVKEGAANYDLQRLEGIRGVYASPVAAKDRIYVVGRDGNMAVIKHGPEFEVLATNSLDDNFDASPAIADQEIYLRGKSHLYAIAPMGGD